MLMNAAASAATTVALLGGSLPDWFISLIIIVFCIAIPFSIPYICRTLFNIITEYKGE